VNTSTQNITLSHIYEWLEEVKDPEIPVLSLVDLGVITEIILTGSDVHIEMTPTFVGCPALDFMQSDIKTVLRKHGIENVEITVTYRVPWSSDRISEKGREAIKKFGLAPPPPAIFPDLEILTVVECPRCDGTETEMRTVFGSTLCRAIYYCRTCQESFEQFKSI
jgi:ring-1,2-phenylacetyl-CoA epoxidase subunit PaaD